MTLQLKYLSWILHELAAGKLSALFSRNASRDLFDAHHLLVKSDLDIEKLKLSFVIYLSMTDIDLSNLHHEYVNYDLSDIKNKLLPVLHQENLPRKPSEIEKWTIVILNELHESLNQILPLNESEINFILQVRAGNIQPELITNDKRLSSVIRTHPAILWMAQKLQISRKVSFQ